MTYCLQDEEEGEGHTLSQEQEGRKEGRRKASYGIFSEGKGKSFQPHSSMQGRKEGRGRLL